MIRNRWWLTRMIPNPPPPPLCWELDARGPAARPCRSSLTRVFSCRRKRTAPRTTATPRRSSAWACAPTSACSASWSTWRRTPTASFRPWMNWRRRRTRRTWGCPTCTRPPRKPASRKRICCYGNRYHNTDSLGRCVAVRILSLWPFGSLLHCSITGLSVIVRFPKQILDFFFLPLPGRNWWSSSRRPERRRRDSARTWKSLRSSSSDRTEGKNHVWKSP